jgi:hypothetical protein
MNIQEVPEIAEKISIKSSLTPFNSIVFLKNSPCQFCNLQQKPNSKKSTNHIDLIILTLISIKPH